MNVREYRANELPALAEIANNHLRNEYEFTPYTARELLDWISNRPKSAILVAGEAEPIGFALLRTVQGGRIADIRVLATPEGSAGESARLGLLGAAESMPYEGISIELSESSSLIDLFASRGYKRKPGNCHFTRSLSSLPEEPPLLEGILVRNLREGEEAELIELINSSYQRERLQRVEIDRWFREDPDFSVDWVQVAEKDDVLVGAACARSDSQYNESYGAKRGYLGPTGTRPEFRGKGINRHLNWRAMKFLRNKGMTDVSLYTAENNAPVHKIMQDLGYELKYTWVGFTKNLQEK